ncbi:UDP-3-O-(3-hydroxymyristoyl)glucosamine N-acyltransferase [Parvularcula lutaonensis]|uniref:UDP-3-O-(3-hydroxymyristoyl)glucosamine N-acyltransferase n=1 Tax=Parvularcula lutaonensis TaxID=491923 RepID=A0ABV7MGJ3_9PROT|nr:UDP-3-O-(3-hydroxymyristoyl)glucosamine N-acyltransferase [Parvularcula lutaonensis]GGY54439.1 UDP-3-O-acylglucosamine N-acyltransferase [Parvularcula lutaonensis]
MVFPDPQFFRFTGALTGEEAAEIGGATLIRSGGTITTVAESGTGGDGALVFAERFKGKIAVSAAIIVPEGKADEAPADTPIVLEVRSPKLAFSRIAAHLFESRFETADEELGKPEIGEGAKIHPSAVICPGVSIGSGAVISAHAVIGHGVTIGERTFVGANASITHAEVGRNCRILSGARVGEAGFGYTAGETGPVAVPQLGAVRLADEVDIGAQTTVDRGTLSDTVIGAMSKIDNLCQIAHNCRLGRGVLVASQTGISGSCVIGDFVMMGGQVGMADHLTVGNGAVVAAQSGLMKDVEPGGKVGGTPAKPMRQWMKETATLGRLARGKK